jgi:hypothetical protein
MWYPKLFVGTSVFLTILFLTLQYRMPYIARQRFCHMSTYYVHGTRLAALSFSSYFELFFTYSNSFGMKLKRKLLAIILYSRPNLIFVRNFYYIWILWRSSATHWAIRSITVQTYLHLMEFLWTKYVRLILCSVLNIDQMKSRFSLGIFCPVLLLDWNL